MWGLDNISRKKILSSIGYTNQLIVVKLRIVLIILIPMS